ncbi:MAG: HAMP domain-containing sensor histidine kinase [Marinoscillum sp.]
MSINIKQTLTLRFVLVFTVLWIFASLAIYYSSAKFRQEEFYERLQTRANTAARLLIDVEEVDAQLLRKIEAANPIQLPGQRLTIYDYTNEELFSTDALDVISVDIDRFNDIRLTGEVLWNQGEIEVLGLLYTGEFDRFVVVASGQDVYGFRKLQYLRNILLLVFVVALVVISFAARLYAGKALQPISEVVEEVNQIGYTNLNRRVSEGNGQDEIATLGITFNSMLNRLQSAFESQRSFITNASHELRTPMTSILSQVDVVLLKDREPEKYKEVLTSIREDVHELSALTARLLLLARVEAFRETLVPIRVDAILWQAIAEVSKTFSNPVAVDFSSDIDDERFLTILGDEQLVKSAVQNAIENACKYSHSQEVRVVVKVADGLIHLEIADQGIGISEVDLPQLGNPFFRGRNTGNFSGSGIGLNLVKRIIELHRGEFTVTSELNVGTCLTIVFRHLKF